MLDPDKPFLEQMQGRRKPQALSIYVARVLQESQEPDPQPAENSVLFQPKYVQQTITGLDVDVLTRYWLLMTAFMSRIVGPANKFSYLDVIHHLRTYLEPDRAYIDAVIGLLEVSATFVLDHGLFQLLICAESNGFRCPSLTGVQSCALDPMAPAHAPDALDKFTASRYIYPDP
jgi:hypothetical protein